MAEDKQDMNINISQSQSHVPVTIQKLGDFVHAPIKRTTFLCWTCLHSNKHVELVKLLTTFALDIVNEIESSKYICTHAI